MTRVLDLRAPLARRPELAGAKAAALAALLQAGLAVPPGFLVTTRAHREWLAEQSSLPAALDNALRAAYAAYPPGTSFAVRASPRVGEPARPAALNCLGVDEVRSAVRECLAAAGEAPQGLTAVLVQSMVQAECSGLARGLDGLTGNSDRLRVLACYGLQLAEGEQDEADLYVLDKADGTALEQRVGAKHWRVVAVRGGLAREPVDPQRAARPCLAPERLVELAELAARVEHECGFPQQLRWALARGRLHLLGVRALHEVAPAWSAQGLPQWVPETASPLLWDLEEPVLRAAFEVLLGRLALPPPGGPWLRRLGPRVEADTALLALYGKQVARLTAAGEQPLSALAWAEGLGEEWACAAQALEPGPEEPQGRATGPRALRQAWEGIERLVAAAGAALRVDAAVALAAWQARALVQQALTDLSQPGARAAADAQRLLSPVGEARAAGEREDLEFDLLAPMAPAEQESFGRLLECGRRHVRLAQVAAARRDRLRAQLRGRLQSLGERLAAAQRLERPEDLNCARREPLRLAIESGAAGAWSALAEVIREERAAWTAGEAVTDEQTAQGT